MFAARLFAAALALGGVAMADDFVDCESGGYDYTYCPADTRFGVQIERQKSNTACVLNETWGYDDGGVWADGGCRATFRILAGSDEVADAVDDAPVDADLIATLEEEDAAERRQPGYGRADAVKLCAELADTREREQGGYGAYIISVQRIVPRGRRTFDIDFTLSSTDPRGRERQSRASCSVDLGRTSTYRRF